MSDVIGYVSDLDEQATVDGRTYRKGAGSYLQAGEPVTGGGTRKVARGVKLDTRGGGELRCGRATFPSSDGRSAGRKATRMIGAVTAPSTRMNPSGMNLRKDAQDRTVTSNGWRSVKLPGEVFATRGALLRAIKAAA